MRFWRRSETELEREIAHHLHHLAAEYERQGHSPADALAMARREFGGAAQVKEQCRDERRFAWFTGFRQDLVYGLRMMRSAPAITAAAVLSLALGIGANAAIASLMDVILWRSLPVPDAKQLRLIHWEGHGLPRDLVDGGSGSMYPEGGRDVADFFSYTAYQRMKEQVAGRASIAAYSGASAVSISYNGRASTADERPVSGNFLTTLQVRPALGRLLLEHDDQASAPATAVVSHRFWAGALASDRDAIGKTLIVNQKPRIIVGVLDPSFFGLFPGDSAAIYVPIHHAGSRGDWSIVKTLPDPRAWTSQLLARVAPGVDVDALRTEMDGVFRSTWTRAPKDAAKAPRLRLDEGARGLANLSRDLRNPLFVLGGLVGLLLVIACANIANLLMARAVARRKEIAMRISLGCSRIRLVRQFLTESALIALLGGAASLGVAYATANLLGQFVGGGNSQPLEASLDWRILLMVGGISTAALVLFGVFPAWHGARTLEASWLKQGSGSIGGAQRRKWTSGRALVVTQMALSVVLVMAAVTFTRNLRAIQTTDPGFDRRNLILFGIRPGTSGYDAVRLPQFYFDLEQRLAATPGVAAAGLTWMRPMNIGGWWERVQMAEGGERHGVSINSVTPSYLPLYTPRLVAGRNVTWADIRAGAKVAVISEDLARRFGGASVLGKRLVLVDGLPGQKRPEYEIVGVVPAFAATSMKDRPYSMWVPLAKDGVEATVVVRTSQSPSVALAAIRRTMNDIDRNVPMVDTITMENQIAKVLQRERMFATLCGGFGILAIALAVVGLYGVMAYNTSRRRGEIGVRLALGALPRNVLAMILREGLAMAVVGIVLGVPVVWLGAKYAEKELFHMKVFEPASIVAALAILLAAALIAVGAPAARASHLQPSETLREQ